MLAKQSDLIKTLRNCRKVEITVAEVVELIIIASLLLRIIDYRNLSKAS